MAGRKMSEETISYFHTLNIQYRSSINVRKCEVVDNLQKPCD